jgi:hypothetical protein
MHLKILKQSLVHNELPTSSEDNKAYAQGIAYVSYFAYVKIISYADYSAYEK